MTFTDKTLVCRECGEQFLFTAGEQEFYQRKGLQNEPGRCPNCRATRRRDQDTGSGFGSGSGFSRSPRQMFPAVCANCGKDTQVPFEPRMGRPVYCNDCFSSMKRSG